MTWKGGGGNNCKDLTMKSKGEEGVKQKWMALSLHDWESCVAMITSL